MSSHPLPTPNAAAPQAGDVAFYRGVLHGLIELGADLARQVHAAAQDDSTSVLDVAQAFDRVARTVRRTIGLARRLDDPVPRAADTAQRRVAARRRILRAVENEIERYTPDDADARSLHGELLERLDGPDVDDDIDHRPIEQIITEICRDLGLDILPGAPAWPRRTPADIAVLCARATGGGDIGRLAPGPGTPRAWEGAG